MTTIIDPPPMTQYNITHGTLAEVYDDRILLRGRNFSSCEWISLAHSEMILKKPCNSGNICIEKTEDSGKITLFAKSEVTDTISFEWYLNGELISIENSIQISPDFGGYIALQAKDEDGGFRSIIYH